jgi:hypothetical protein
VVKHPHSKGEALSPEFKLQYYKKKEEEEMI